MPQALTSFSPIIARTFITILFTFFIISLSFLSMFYNTKLRAFVLAQFENLGELVAQFENLGELVKNTIFVA